MAVRIVPVWLTEPLSRPANSAFKRLRDLIVLDLVFELGGLDDLLPFDRIFIDNALKFSSGCALHFEAAGSDDHFDLRPQHDLGYIIADLLVDLGRGTCRGEQGEHAVSLVALYPGLLHGRNVRSLRRTLSRRDGKRAKLSCRQ